MMQIGLMLKTEETTYLICKDPNGYPDLICLAGPPFSGSKKESAQRLYQELSGNPYPLPQATTRQVLWDLLEAALKQLP
jgi:hypothetical protein